MRVSTILKSKGDDGVVTVAPDTPVHEVAATLGARRIGTVVVSGDGRRAAGILSERDVVRAVGRDGAAALDQAASALMTPDPKTCAPEDAAEDVLRRMTAGRFRHMPVVEAGEMVGMVSLGDVVKARLEEAEAERAALSEMVAGR